MPNADRFRQYCRITAAALILLMSTLVGWELYTRRATPVSQRDVVPVARLHSVVGHGPKAFWRAIRDKLRIAGGGSLALLLLGEAAVALRRRREDS